MARTSFGGRSKARKTARPLNRKDASIKRWEKPSDIPLDEEDEFHASRDRILLDGEGLPSDDEGDEEEVFALKGMSDESDEDDEGEAGGSFGDDDDDDDNLEELAANVAKANAKAASKKAKGKQKEGPPPSSDASDSESEDEGWGRNKASYYSSNAAQLESDDEEANELEEQEAKRLQSKVRDVMVDDDFGLGDIPDTAPEEEFEAGTEHPPPVVENLPSDKQSLLRHLEKTNPEALALARDWDDIARTLVRTQQKIAQLEEQQEGKRGEADIIGQGMIHLYYQALLQYSVTLAFYLYLRSSDEYVARPELLRSHPIMGRLLTFKQHISTLEELEADDDEEYFSGSDLEEYQLFKNSQKEAADELRALMEESLLAMQQYAATLNAAPAESKKEKAPTEKKPKETKAGEPPKKKRKTAKPALPVFDLEEPEFPAKTKSSSRTPQSVDTDAFGEHTALDTADAQDKAARKRSLRFHTAKIESGSARRERARAGTGGDDDIPWKERRKEREERQKKELEKSRGQGGDDLDGEEPEPSESLSKKRRRDEEGSDDDDAGEAEGYYDLVKRKSREKKEKKKEDYETAKALERDVLIEADTADGPRALTRAILKNKGLTPHRPKSVRNPRVKKRMRYEQAKKKVASQKAVYKGGISDTGRYEGEKSGISKVIKSRRL
ncbi:hypothetical protein NM688_g6111 [Phlebia brevispora]|uniref:Uncharacterized protein n=1 Tax=Phlebia brevispora TaxID=194682 RepID=A0ACC1SJZ8_9APHY|nr:hypothetical protein NM688_g6111 [Phlebia brevispora]